MLVALDGSFRHHTRFVPSGSRANSEQCYGSVREARIIFGRDMHLAADRLVSGANSGHKATGGS